MTIVAPITARRFLEHRQLLIAYVTANTDDELEPAVAEELLASGLIDTDRLTALTGGNESRYE